MPQYARLQIGTVEGEKQKIWPRSVGALSAVPYAEPTWLSKGYHSPYYKDVRKVFCLCSQPQELTPMQIAPPEIPASSSQIR